MSFKEVYENFVDLQYKPSKNELVCSFYIEPAKGHSAKRAAGAVAAESSVGTWTNVKGLGLKHVQKIAATVFDIKGNWVKIAYPLNNFELGNMSQIYSSIAGNIFGMKAVNNLRLVDVQWPAKLRNSFPGPQFGIKGMRKKFKIKKRPFLVCVPKPKVGMTSKEHAKIGWQVWTGGVDLLKDDENLASQPFNKFENRVQESMKQAHKAEHQTGEQKAGLFNVTAPGKELYKRASLVAKYNNPYVMVDLLTVGWSGVQGLREHCQDLKLGLYAHRAFHAAFTRNPKHGVSMLVVAETARLIGVDNIHIGTGVGKLVGSKKEVKTIQENSVRQKIRENKTEHLLKTEWGNIKPVIPVSSGGLHPGSVPEVMSFLGKDIGIQIGGGIHGHPNGSHDGAVAARSAVEAVMQGKSLKEKAKQIPELRVALETWGYKHIK
ncbi:type III ribulose-bisphosphate carboxylase [Candidatus Micrarchaeota archaeon]|nr:type III ribulose-bisphosphate carboxylase [Candidatus Micrarchaeota archaeon]MBU1931035.1 type III ribulose-bisphosphate carboxylase [Candidatus Micrarchaeota archaeon]